MLTSVFRAIDRADERIDRWLTGDRSTPSEERHQATTWGSWAGEDPPTHVTETSALRLLAVTGSVQLLTESIATLPVDVFRRTSTGRSEVSVPPWLREPVVGLTFIDWCTQVLTSLLLHGNAYLVVTRNSTGTISEITPVDPSDVTVRRDGGNLGGRKRYIVRGNPFTGELVHIKGMMLAGSDVGLSPLEFARQSIQLGLSAQDYGINNFDSGLKMPGVIEYPGSVDPAKMGETARLWQRSRRKGGHGLPGVLEGGGTFKAMGITNEAAQFLQTRQWTAAEICAQVYLIDPRELGIPLTGSTLEYVNSESRMANLVRKGMLRWITRIEAAITGLLPSPQYMKFNVNGFMRGDSTERWDTYMKAARINVAAAALGQAPVLLTDEMRDWEDLDPLPSDVIVPPAVAVTVPQLGDNDDSV
jgi:HK97 family phage portal protein